MARFLIIFLLAGFIAVPAPVICGPGEKGPEYSRLIGRFDPKTDTWAEYVVIDKISGKRSRLRLVIDGTVGDSFWYEVAGNRDDVDYIFKNLDEPFSILKYTPEFVFGDVPTGVRDLLFHG